MHARVNEEAKMIKLIDMDEEILCENLKPLD